MPLCYPIIWHGHFRKWIPGSVTIEKKAEIIFCLKWQCAIRHWRIQMVRLGPYFRLRKYPLVCNNDCTLQYEIIPSVWNTRFGPDWRSYAIFSINSNLPRIARKGFIFFIFWETCRRARLDHIIHQLPIALFEILHSPLLIVSVCYSFSGQLIICTSWWANNRSKQ